MRSFDARWKAIKDAQAIRDAEWAVVWARIQQQQADDDNISIMSGFSDVSSVVSTASSMVSTAFSYVSSAASELTRRLGFRE